MCVKDVKCSEDTVSGTLTKRLPTCAGTLLYLYSDNMPHCHTDVNKEALNAACKADSGKKHAALTCCQQ